MRVAPHAHRETYGCLKHVDRLRLFEPRWLRMMDVMIGISTITTIPSPDQEKNYIQHLVRCTMYTRFPNWKLCQLQFKIDSASDSLKGASNDSLKGVSWNVRRGIARRAYDSNVTIPLPWLNGCYLRTASGPRHSHDSKQSSGETGAVLGLRPAPATVLILISLREEIRFGFMPRPSTYID